MKIQPIFFALFALVLTSCNAQTTAFTVSNTVKGNTGHRGIIPQGEENKPIEGKDYYAFELTMTQNCTLEMVGLTVKKDGGQVNLTPKFDDGQVKKKVKKGDVIYVNVQKEKDVTVAKPSIAGEGSLQVKVNGKLKRVPIESFKLIMPM